MRSEILENLGINVKNKENIIKFLPVMCIIDDSSLNNKIKILKFHKIPLTSLSQLKVLGLSSSELERRITVSKSNDFFVEVINNPLTLLKSDKFMFRNKKPEEFLEPFLVEEFVQLPKEVVEQKTSQEEIVPVIEEDKVMNLEEKTSDLLSLIDSADEVKEEEVKKIFIVPKSKEVEESLPSLNEYEYFKYERLATLATRVSQCINIDLVSRGIDIDLRLMKLIKVSDFTDEEILYKAFSTSTVFTKEETYSLLKAINECLFENISTLERIAA